MNPGNVDDKKNKGSNQSNVHPLSQRRSMGSFKRYSLKLRRNTKDGIKEMSSDGDCTEKITLNA